MAFFGNFNLAPYTVTPAKSPEGKLFMFFGTIPQELTIYGPAPVAMITPATVQISIPDEEEDSDGDQVMAGLHINNHDQGSKLWTSSQLEEPGPSHIYN